MRKQHDFEVGDMIRILDGHGIEDYAGGWYPEDMSHLIGKIYKVFEIYKPRYGTASERRTRYRIRDEKGQAWSIDARGAEKVETNRPILISEHISKKGRRVVEAWQDSIVACAVCHPEDEFDYFYGVELALTRLKEAQKREKKRKEKADLEALMENNYMTKGFVI